jgi:hypothetical protein
MRAYSFGEDTKRVQWASRTLGLNMIRTFSAGIVWGIVMLVLSLGSGCGNGGDAGNSGGSTSGRNSDDNTVSDVQGEIDPKWPSDKLPKSVPPIAGAKVLRSMQDGDDFGVVFMCKRRTIETYIQHLEQIGWNIDKDMGSDGNDALGAISRFLSNDEGEHLQVSWQSGGGTGTLGYSKK